MGGMKFEVSRINAFFEIHEIFFSTMKMEENFIIFFSLFMD